MRSRPAAVALLLASSGCGTFGEVVDATDSGMAGDAPLSPPDDASVDASGIDGGCRTWVRSFDGVDDAVAVAHSAELNLEPGFTVEAWIRPSAAIATGEGEMHIASHHENVEKRGWVLLIKNRRLEVRIYGTGEADGDHIAGNDGLPYVLADRWAHVAATSNGTNISVFHDGQLRDTAVIAPLVRVSSQVNLTIGRSAAEPKFHFQGFMRAMRISQSARYLIDFAPTPPGDQMVDATTLAFFRLDEQTLKDAAGRQTIVLPPPQTTPSAVMTDCFP